MKFLFLSLAMLAQFGEDGPAEKTRKHSVDIFPLGPLVDIYAVQYGLKLGPASELTSGFAYVNIVYEDVGRSYAPTILLGYKHYLWRNLHAEYQLWPAYNNFFSYADQRYYPGFEVYNEVRAGYRFDFSVANRAFYLNLQYLFGFGLYPGNKPQNFLDLPEKTFHSPIFFIGTRF